MTLYPWHSHALVKWQAMYARGHEMAALFHGANGVGQDELGRWCTRIALCPQSKGQEACGQCQSCRLMDLGEHPDCYIIKLETESRVIKQEQIAKVCQKVFQTGALSPKRMVCIDGADKLNDSAANALLKTLEEPPEGCGFVFSTSAYSQILPTIRSRALSITVSANLDESRQWLATVTPSSTEVERDTALACACGAPLLAQGYCDDPDALCIQLAFVDALVNDSPLAQLVSMADGLGGDLTLSLLLAVLADCLRLQAESDKANLFFPHIKPALSKKVAAFEAPELWQAQIDLRKIVRVREQGIALNGSLFVDQVIVIWRDLCIAHKEALV